MGRKKLSRQLLIGYLSVMVLPLFIASWYTSRLYRNTFIDQIVISEKKNAYLVGADLTALLVAGNNRGIDSLCKWLSRDIDMRITIIAPSGKVIGDSERDPDSMENHAYRPEIMKALEGNTGTAQRLSTTLKKQMLYVAWPLYNNNTLTAIIRTAVPLDTISTALRVYYGKIVMVALILAMFALMISFLFTSRVTLPVRELEAGAKRFASGDFSNKIPLPDIDELKNLGVALNDMAGQLHSRIQTITARKNEQEAILASMSEVVVAADGSGRVLLINQAAADLFGVERSAASGKLFGEIIRNSALQKITDRIFQSGNPVEEDVIYSSLTNNERRDVVLRVNGTVLHDADNRPAGVVLVASDVTRLRKLETIHKEFVANVSHELRTPLTAIKGFVETLQQGAIESRDDAKRFLDIISAQVVRLGTLVDDLLMLARIEKEEEDQLLAFEEQPIMPIVNEALRDYTAQAAAKRITVEASGDGALGARVNAAMLLEAVGNLIDNAIKYSEAGKNVLVSVNRERNGAVISVADQGIGIPAEHINRIFERFYRVDKARSRKAGGTGLGLSIVKHIAGLHNGRVSVQSEPGKGSVFSILLPLTQTSEGNNDRHI
jgi:two-component system, OmpR family, phosphate regulon sensor histidine kinase PhoR